MSAAGGYLILALTIPAASQVVNADMDAASAVLESTSGCRLLLDGERGAWTFEVDGQAVVAEARVAAIVPRAVAIPEGTRFIRLRLFQHGGDWDAYLGYLEFRRRGEEQASYRDSFTSETLRKAYARAENVMWRTDTEGGLLCPNARDVWAEIVYEAAPTEIRWVYQVVDADSVIEVYASADGDAWTLLTRKSGEGGITPHFRDEDAAPLMDAQAVPLGPARCRKSAADDKLGPAERAVLEREIASGLRLSAEFTLLKAVPVVAVDLALENVGKTDAEVLGLRPGGGFRLDVGGPAERCTVIPNDYWFGPRHIVRLDEQTDTTEWWATALVDRATERTAVLGIAEAANAGVTYRLRREGTEVRGEIDADLSPTRARTPLIIPAGASFRLCRLLVLEGEQVHAALEQYGDLIVKNAEVKLRHRAYSGLFTGYSSSPDLTTVVRLDEARVMKLVGLLKEKVGRYGIDTVKIEFEPCGSPNLLDPERYHMVDYFSKGPRALTDALRGLGCHPALQSRTFTYVTGGAPHERERTAEHYRRFTREWGFEYLMLDFNETDIRNEDHTRPLMQVFRDRFRMIREAVGDEVFIEACMIPYGPVIGTADGYRASIDYRGGNEDLLLGNFATRYHLHGRVFQLDTEFYDIAERPFVWGARNVVTPLEGTRAWVSLCGLTGYSFLFGGAIEETSDERFHLASRALPVSGVAARPIDLAEHALPEVWSLSISRERPWRQTIGLFNWDYEGARTVMADLARCGLPPGRTFAAFDFWQGRFLGEVSDRLEARLPARNAQVVWLTEIGDRPEVIGGTRHLTGFLNGRVTGWDAGNHTLRGVASGHGDEQVSLFVYVPQRWSVRSAAGASFEQVEQRAVRLDVPTPGEEEAKWAVAFDPAATVR